MVQLLRPLLPVVAVALLLTVALALWIRAEPLAMPTPLQVALSLLLVGAVAALLAYVRREEAGESDDVS